MNKDLGPRVFLFAALFSLAAGLLCGWTGREAGSSWARESGGRTWDQLNYILGWKDDMGLIDWGKSLEKSPWVLAFRVLRGGQVVLEGGNRDLLPVNGAEGISFLPPSHWSYTRGVGGGTGSLRLELLLGSVFSPLVLGFAGGVLVLTGFIGGILSLPPSKVPRGPGMSEGFEKKAREPMPAVETEVPPGKGMAYLLLDGNLVIRKVSAEASELLGWSGPAGGPAHLLDLQPDQVLLKALKDDFEVELLNPFLSAPNLRARLRPEGTGKILFLERGKELEPPQNR